MYSRKYKVMYYKFIKMCVSDNCGSINTTADSLLLSSSNTLSKDLNNDDNLRNVSIKNNSTLKKTSLEIGKYVLNLTVFN